MKISKLLFSMFRVLLIGTILFLLTLSGSEIINMAKSYPSTFNYSIAGVTMIILLIGVVSFSSKINIIDIKEMKVSRKDISNCTSWLLIMIIVKIVGGILLLFEGENTTYNQKGLENFLDNVPLLIIILFALISGPIIEEILFRGFLLKICFKNHIVIGIVISSFLFGIAHHPTNLGSLFTYTGMGIVLGLYYQKYNRIELTIMLHFVNNFISLIPYIYHH